MSSRRRVLAEVACVAVAVALCILRVWFVNASAVEIPVRTYSPSEFVPLDGDFAEFEYENTDGYSVRLDRAQRMSVNEYIAAYAKDAALTNAYMSDENNATDPNAKTLIVLDITLRNDKSEEDERGYLDSIGWSVTEPSRPEYWIRCQSSLFESSVPQINGDFRVSIKPGTQYQIHVPFASTTVPTGFPHPQIQYAIPEMAPGAYQFLVTKAPTRKQVAFTVQ